MNFARTLPASSIVPRPWSICGQAPVQLRLAAYDVASFDSTMFAQAGVAQPASITKAVARRQAAFFYGRLCAQAALAALGVRGVSVGTGAQREPLWPQGVIGSITHRGDLAGAVALPASRYRGVGIDIERYADDSALGAIEDVVLNRGELAFLRAHGATLGDAALLSVAFSAKESFYKAVFGVVQRIFDFNAIEIDALDIDALDIGQGTIGFTLTETLCDDWRCGARGQAGFDLLGDRHVLTGVLW